MYLGVHHEAQQLRDVVMQLAAIDNRVDHTVVQQKLRSLEILWQFLSNGLLDNARAGKTDERLRLSENHVAKHREACRDAAGGWVSQDRNKRQTRFIQRSQRRGDLRH